MEQGSKIISQMATAAKQAAVAYFPRKIGGNHPLPKSLPIAWRGT
jgi:hypothetical protein